MCLFKIFRFTTFFSVKMKKKTNKTFLKIFLFIYYQFVCDSNPLLKSPVP